MGSACPSPTMTQTALTLVIHAIGGARRMPARPIRGRLRSVTRKNKKILQPRFELGTFALRPHELAISTTRTDLQNEDLSWILCPKMFLENWGGAKVAKNKF